MSDMLSQAEEKMKKEKEKYKVLETSYLVKAATQLIRFVIKDISFRNFKKN